MCDLDPGSRCRLGAVLVTFALFCNGPVLFPNKIGAIAVDATVLVANRPTAEMLTS